MLKPVYSKNERKQHWLEKLNDRILDAIGSVIAGAYLVFAVALGIAGVAALLFTPDKTEVSLGYVTKVGEARTLGAGNFLAGGLIQKLDATNGSVSIFGYFENDAAGKEMFYVYDDGLSKVCIENVCRDYARSEDENTNALAYKTKRSFFSFFYEDDPG